MVLKKMAFKKLKSAFVGGLIKRKDRRANKLTNNSGSFNGPIKPSFQGPVRQKPVRQKEVINNTSATEIKPVTPASPVTPPVTQPTNARDAFIQQGVQQKINGNQTPVSTDTAPVRKEPEQDKTRNAYIDFLRTQANPEQAKLAQQNVNDLTRLTSEEVARNREREQLIAENKKGQLSSGQSFDQARESRQSSAALADLALAKGYSTDILNQQMEAGASLAEAQQAAAQEANEVLPIEDAQTLGVPFGTTIAVARQMGIIPSSGGEDELHKLSEGQALVDSQGNIIAQRGKTFAPKSARDKDFSASQFEAATFAQRTSQASQTFEQLKEFVSGLSTTEFFLQSKAPNAIQSSEMQQLKQAERNFVNAVLRRESGAAIAPSEFSSAEQQYFPRPGDQQEVIAQKKANRDIVMQGLRNEAGGALGGFQQQGVTQPSGGVDYEAYLQAINS